MREPRELEGEAEVDLGRYAAAVAARWWLVLLGLVAGVLVGLLLSVGGEEVYRASALVYPGQTLSPSGTAQVQSLSTNPATVREIVRSEAAIRRVASESGYGTPARLRQNVSVAAAQGAVARVGQTQLANVVVTGPAPRRTAAAANGLAKVVVQRVGAYAETKIETLEGQIAASRQELAGIEERIDATQQAIEEEGLTTTERLVLLNLVGFAEQRRTTVQSDLAARQQLLALTVDVERPRIVEPAVARRVTAQSRRNTLVVAGVLGLLAGLAAALAWDPVSRRVPRRVTS